MGNIVDSVLNVEGVSEVVDQFLKALPSLIEQDKETVYYTWAETEAILERGDLKTVSVRFETKWHFPSKVLLAGVRKFHHLGLDFHMWWHDDDGGLGHDPLFGGYCGDLVIHHMCFGEVYTKELCGSWFSKGQGEMNFLALDPATDGYEDCHGNWFRQRIDGDTEVKTMTEEELREVVSAAYPERSIVTAKFAKPHEVLLDCVVSRVQKLNDLIRDTWGPQWFESNNKKFGEVTEEELGGLYDRLIEEAYPEEAAWLRKSAEPEAQREQNRFESVDVPDDYFAALARAPIKDEQASAS